MSWFADDRGMTRRDLMTAGLAAAGLLAARRCGPGRVRPDRRGG